MSESPLPFSIQDRLPASMLVTLAATGVVISVCWLLIAKSLGDRIIWLDMKSASMRGQSMNGISRIVDRAFPDERLMNYALLATFAGAWILLAIIKITL